jgi:membrane protease YdiL (CAAX protease family)
MKTFIKDNWKFLLFVLLGGLVGGYCLGLYSYDSLTPDLLKQLQDQNVTKEMVALSTMFQYGIMFGLILAIIGLFLSKKIGLWKEFKFDKKAVITTLIITLASALLLFPGDKLLFGTMNTWVAEQYTVKPTIYKIIGGLLVGGIIEEVMMRLFFMSLIVFIVSKVLKKKEIPTCVFIIANIISALLFAAAHLPSTMSMTTLTPVLVIRCFLFNGCIGLAFGYLYRKYNIRYAMASHGLCHLIADILMLIFI